MKILSIGDIHGRDAWKFLTHGSSYDYDSWRTACDHGADHDGPFWKEMPFTQVDKIVFIGDYVDSFTVNNVSMKKELEDIIDFKKRLGDKVVLLLGNHDVQYIVHNQICSGYRPEMRADFWDIFTKNINLFTMAYEYKNYLWTHAGVSAGWLKELRKEFMDRDYRFHEIIKDRNPSTIAECINLAWELRMDIIYNVDAYSGGWSTWAGPIWVRPNILDKNPLDGISQIVGHTPQAAVWSHEINSKVTHHYIDCLEHGELDGFTIEL